MGWRVANNVAKQNKHAILHVVIVSNLQPPNFGGFYVMNGEIDMKKFFIPAALSVVACNAFAISIDEPKVSANASAWELFSGSVVIPENLLYGDGLSGFIRKDSIGGDFDKNKEGTEARQYAAVVLMAREIYANGGKFCITQIQSAYKQAYRWQWLDYYAPAASNCFVMCKPGFSGSKCETQSVTSCDTTNYTSKFSGYKKDPFKNIDKITSSVEVISQKNQRNKDRKDVKAEHIVLGVVDVQEHGLKVAPVRIEGDRYDVMTIPMAAWIAGVRIVGKAVTLCASGYKYGTSTGKCEPDDMCETEGKLGNLCSGYNRSDYDASQHNIAKCVSDSSKYMFRCRGGFAFETSTSKKCVQCDGMRQGQNGDTGVCEKCNIGDVFSKNEKRCVAARGISKQDMMYGIQGKQQQGNCWEKITPSEYIKCVMCN